MATLAEPRSLTTGRHIAALDGVRALAVGAVVTYHLGAEWLPGGFLGVDLFFVLSGFLITGILLSEVDRTGRLSFSDFFTRRARRLLPALYLLLIVVCGWAAFVALPQAIGDLRGAALAALFYVANWFFILTGQSYFADTMGPSPLEHTWSLAIEEQYYLVWPLLVLFLARKAGSRAFVVVTTLLLAASVVLMAVQFDSGDPSIAYFGTLSRLHELLVGALLAYLVSKGVRLAPSLQWTAWIALAGIVVMMVSVSDVSAFYYRGGSLLFCGFTAWLLLSLDTGPPQGGTSRLFSWGPLVWIGMLSYGIYLWHWPLILWLTPITTGLSELPLAVLRMAVTLLIAIASFYLVERPIRRGFIGNFALTPRRLLVLVPAAMVVLSAVIVASTVRAVPATSDESVAPLALSGSSVPGAPVLAVAGDSVPKELMPFFEDEAAARGWALVPLSFRGCGITGVFQLDEAGKPFPWSDRCSSGFADMQSSTVASFDPDVVIWYSNRERWAYRTDGIVMPMGTQEHRQQLDRDLEAAFRRFTEHGARLVIVVPVPRAPATYGKCMEGRPAVPECALDDAYYASFVELRNAYSSLKARHPDRVTLVEIDDLLCPGYRDCPRVDREAVPVRPDGIHFSPEGAAWFLPLLFDRANIDTTRVNP